MEHSLHVESNSLDINTLVILMVIAALVAVAVKKIKIPYTIALVFMGLALGFIHALKPIVLTEHIVLFIFLPALLFEAAWNLDIKHLKHSFNAIAILATLGVAISILVIGASLHYLLGLEWIISLIFGALVAPTDPVSVVAIMKKLHLDHRLSALVEGESLFNDGTSVVFFKLLLAMLINFGLSIPSESLVTYLSSGLLQFIMVVFGAAAIGALVGLGFSVITKYFNDHLLELSFTTITAYGSFLLAESISVPGEIPHMHLSGVVATVVAGLVMGNYGRQTGMSASTKIVISSFWEYAAFFMNSLIFLLIGLEIEISKIISNWSAILIAVLAVFLARAISVYLLSGISNLTKLTKLDFNWQHILVMSGLRGALSMALVLSIPRDIISGDLRETLIIMVFGVVLVSLVAQGLSISSVIKFLGLSNLLSPSLRKYQFLNAQIRCARSSLTKLHDLEKSGAVIDSVSDQIKKDLDEEIQSLREEIDELKISNEMIILEDIIETKTQLIQHRKSLINEMVLQGGLDIDSATEIKAELDSELERLASKH